MSQFCGSCGKPMTFRVRFCPHCGAVLGAAVSDEGVQGDISDCAVNARPAGDLVYPSNPPKSPFLALLGIFGGGIPSLLFGQIGKGVAMFIVFILVAPTVLGAFVLILISIIDGFKVGAKLKSGRPVRKWEFFPH